MLHDNFILLKMIVVWYAYFIIIVTNNFIVIIYGAGGAKMTQKIMVYNEIKMQYQQQHFNKDAISAATFKKIDVIFL